MTASLSVERLFPNAILKKNMGNIGRNYVSIIITIISNITVCHGVNKKAPAIVSPTTFPYKVLTRLVCCFTRNILSTFFCSDQIIGKK